MIRSKVSVVTGITKAGLEEGEEGGGEGEEEKETCTPVEAVLATPTTLVPVFTTTGLFPIPGLLEEEEEISLATFSQRDWKPLSNVRAPSPYLLLLCLMEKKLK